MNKRVERSVGPEQRARPYGGGSVGGAWRSLGAWLAALLLGFCGLAVPLATRAGVPEVHYPARMYKMLDSFEEHQLRLAEKTFAKRNYRLAAKQYDQFILEFPRSKAVAYALLRKGRCLQFDNKRYAAIEEYEEVLDYFPDTIEFAAPAKYYIGECYWLSEDYVKAYKAWAEMADDEDYCKHYLAGTALKRLADNMVKRKKYDDAIKYFMMVILNFRKSTEHRDLQSAIDQVLYHHVRREPSEKKFRNYYRKAQGIWTNARRIGRNLEEDWEYWKNLRYTIWRFSSFPQHQKAEKHRYFSHWANALNKKYRKNDEFQIDVAKMGYQAHGTLAKYHRRLDQLYSANLTAKNHNDRVAHWIGLFSGSTRKIAEYYKKIKWRTLTGWQGRCLMWSLVNVRQPNLAKEVYPRIKLDQLNFDQRFELMRMIWDRLRDAPMARNLFGKLGLPQQGDGKKAGVARWFWRRDEKIVLQCYQMMGDQDYADFNRMSYFDNIGNYTKGLEYGMKSTNVDKYAERAWWTVASMHVKMQAWAKAIAAYRRSTNQPASLYQIAECYKNWNKLGNAIQQLVEIENFFKSDRSRAAWSQAVYYRHFGRDKLENAALWKVMGKYTASAQARSAHERLEEKGLRIGKTVDKARWEEILDQQYLEWNKK